jgi:glyoxylase-like metal-dependent hydrolase (beta-lactamase superfamily II)
MTLGGPMGCGASGSNLAPAHQPSPLIVGDARLDRVVDIDRFELDLRWLFPDADAKSLAAHRHWLEPGYMRGESLALSIHSIVLRVAGRVILIDTCVGEHKSRPRQPHWHARGNTDFLAHLDALGIAPENVDIVFCTHLHADHVGWNTRSKNGRWVPTFPNARYLVDRTELAHWETMLNTEPAAMVNHNSYADSVLPVIEAGQVDLIDGEHDILHGLSVRPLPGHTPGQIGLSVRRQDQACLIVGDAIHHPVQLVRPEWSTRVCADPHLARSTRRALLEEVADREDWLVPMHFRDTLGLQIRRLGDGFIPRDADRIGP